MARVTVEDCVKKITNRFELCLIANNRAKAISAGADTEFERVEKPSVIALREIADDLVDIDNIRDSIINKIKVKSLEDYGDYSTTSDSEEVGSNENIVLKSNIFVEDNINIED